MDLKTRLATDLVAAHPLEAAQAFERLPARDVAALLERLEIEPGARALQQMALYSAAAVATELPEARASEVVERLPTEFAALLLRSVDAAARERLLAALSSRRARELRSLLAFPENTAGSLMDPEVLALPQDLTAKEALVRVREAAGHARYNVYIVDRDQALVGVINLRELLIARPADLLSSLMQTAVQRLAARADRRTIVSHPGWRTVHALPVVDERGRYLGAVRYRTLRRLEEELRGALSEETTTARALGGLFRAGASAMLEAMVASTPPERYSTEPGRSRDGA
jgi:Mg/Co/Ni transporter MgtE